MHLITYAAPVTRKMLQFNNLTYYSVPSMPSAWKAPQWLTVELGFFAGRLYFEYEEYNDLRAYLGLQEGDQRPEMEDAWSPIEAHPIEDIAAISLNDPSSPTHRPRPKTFTTKPLQFLQDWLALRRRGQDFTHTPMGHVCQDKPLSANHAFFTKFEKEEFLGHGGKGMGSGFMDHVEDKDAAEEGLDEEWGDDLIGGYGMDDEPDGEEVVGWEDENASSEDGDGPTGDE